MMNSQIIQYQEYLSVSILYQTSQEIDHGLGVHSVFINHKANFAFRLVPVEIKLMCSRFAEILMAGVFPFGA